MILYNDILSLFKINWFRILQWFRDFFKIGWWKWKWKWKWKCQHKQNSRIAQNSRDQKCCKSNLASSTQSSPWRNKRSYFCQLGIQTTSKYISKQLSTADCAFKKVGPCLPNMFLIHWYIHRGQNSKQINIAK